MLQSRCSKSLLGNSCVSGIHMSVKNTIIGKNNNIRIESENYWELLAKAAMQCQLNSPIATLEKVALTLKVQNITCNTFMKIILIVFQYKLQLSTASRRTNISKVK